MGLPLTFVDYFVRTGNLQHDHKGVRNEKHGKRVKLAMGISNRDFLKLKRKINPMPNYVKQALEQRGLMEDFFKRPPYQQNDYIGWIERAKRQDTKEKRLSQMLDELEVGGVYMKMKHPASAKK